MKPIVLFATLVLAGAAIAQVANRPLHQSTQLVVVTTPDWNAVDGKMQRYERKSARDAWQPVGNPISIVVGRTGLAWGVGMVPTEKLKAASDPLKHEGDGKSPAGMFRLGTAFGSAPQNVSGSKLPYLNLTPSIECVDDTKSGHYNQLLDRASVKPDWDSSEKMLATGEAYRWGVVVGYNGGAGGKRTPGAGSCIFLHIWKGPGHGTAGCTAMPKDNVEELIGWLDPAKHPTLVQLPVAEYARLLVPWKLPTVAVIAH